MYFGVTLLIFRPTEKSLKRTGVRDGGFEYGANFQHMASAIAQCDFVGISSVSFAFIVI